ncbi:DEAD/DEAH box helicase [Agrobacterium rubi]|uniref:DEAD/DEAH box helicase n=1 Tax=Agrobacterium rubi TaxID=28099 RepID=A0AAE7USP8_9HYPH|nr:DEAD/DEAH box helicase [Agrobacterium rubi]NTE88174.1 DEAD/DEAH box helicase [Agrobacterium rubi]NTF03940.1 DEAD/DEAH box helicase [Agrobacterium rubi]NTF38271.1 DEAD/DEAH box helicase [Agrobacterium rubi]OCJ46976.1 DEAD/DEAH box helicase [Agrobacterium rubi]QTG02095.1 DEAD/DEAH box helicase [Agrobacterium rubi]
MTETQGIAPAIAQALEKRGYNDLTPVQKAMLAPELDGQDALVSAQTGSGKTVAFGMAIAPTLLQKNGRFGQAGAPLGIAIAPTRELAMQVMRELEWLYEFTGVSIASCVGGMDIRAERRALERGAHIIVGTPGRLCDHIKRKALDLSSIRAVVLDEADEMLDLGFREDLEFILEESPAERRTLMFSATVSRSIAKLAESYQKNAVRVATTSEQKQHVDIEYRAMVVSPSDRENAIINALRFYEARNAIVFCSTRAAVNHLTARLNNRGFSVVALSGELSQNERTHALQAMRDGRARVCVATDVAARGIDLPGLELVIHADLPTNSDTLLHRSGRTGRAGQKGISAIIVPMSQRRKAERLLEGAKVSPAWVRPPSAEEITQRDGERLLADASLTENVNDNERDFVAKLLEQHGAEKVAAAFVRLYHSGRSAPEDIAEVSIDGARKPRRDGFETVENNEPRRDRSDFSDSGWFTLSVGRKQNAEPRWLIPMLCRFGKLTRQDIGAIRMQQTETYVELAADAVDRFTSALGKDMMLEKGIRVKAMDGKPDMTGGNREDTRPAKAQRKFAAKPAAGGERRTDDKPWKKKPAPAGDRPAQFDGKKDKPFEKRAPKKKDRT